MRASLIRSSTLFGAAVLGLFAVFYGFAVLSYSAGDAAFNSAAADVQHNWMGRHHAVSIWRSRHFPPPADAGICTTLVARSPAAAVETAAYIMPVRHAADRVWHGLLAARQRHRLARWMGRRD